MRILPATPGSVAASTSPGPARADARHRPSTPRRQQHPFFPPAMERQCPALELQGRGFWQVQLPELEVVPSGGFNTLALDVGGHQAIRA